ncbi:hypothetical protein BOX15_Mlig023685g2, partial [Macrostomum lignano]
NTKMPTAEGKPLTLAGLGGSRAPENRIVHGISGTTFYNLDAGQQQAARRGASLSAKSMPMGIVPNDRAYRRILYLQHVMTRQDGLLVWQKFPSYRLAANAMLAISGAGFLYSLGLCASMAIPKKN